MENKKAKQCKIPLRGLTRKSEKDIDTCVKEVTNSKHNLTVTSLVVTFSSLSGINGCLIGLLDFFFDGY